MKYNVFTSQVFLSMFDNLDFNDGAIISFLADFMNTKVVKTKTDKDGRIFFWFSHKLIMEQLPCLRITSERSIFRRMMKLVECGLLVPHHANKATGFSYYATGQAWIDREQWKDLTKSVRQKCPTALDKNVQRRKTEMSNELRQKCPSILSIRGIEKKDTSDVDAHAPKESRKSTSDLLVEYNFFEESESVKKLPTQKQEAATEDPPHSAPPPRRMTMAEKKIKRVRENTPLMVRIGMIRGREPDFLWTEYEAELLAMVGPSEREIRWLEKYHSLNIPPGKDFRRRNIVTLLQNWNTEVDSYMAYEET